MHNRIHVLLVMIFFNMSLSAQFYTVKKEPYFEKISSLLELQCIENEGLSNKAKQKELKVDSIEVDLRRNSKKSTFIQKSAKRTSPNLTGKSYNYSRDEIGYRGLPKLTVENLYEEIKRNNIQHPKIVLAQAILETGWFKSSVCRNQNNLFGLTNPRTGKYYEFNHWTESVRAYYTKVQYRYKGGNYLIWLRNIGYAEDPNYIRSVIKVLRML